MAKNNAMAKFLEKTGDLKVGMFAHEIQIKSNIIILPEFRDLIPSLGPDESKQLEENLLKHGIKDPLSVWETTAVTVLEGLDDDSDSRNLFADLNNDEIVYVLVDGHNREKIAQQHGLDYRLNILKFPDISEVKDYMINYQLGRRNLTPEQSSYLRGLRYNKLKEANRSDRINVAEQLASEHNVSARTIKRDAEYAKGLDNLTSDLKENVLSGKTKLPKNASKILSKAKPETPFSSISSIKQFLDDEKGSIDNAKDLAMDDMIDSVINPPSNESLVAESKNLDLATIDLSDFKQDSESELANKSQIAGVPALSEVIEGGKKTDNEVVRSDDLETSIRSLASQNLSTDVLEQIIQKAEELIRLLQK